MQVTGLRRSESHSRRRGQERSQTDGSIIGSGEGMRRARPLVRYRHLGHRQSRGLKRVLRPPQSMSRGYLCFGDIVGYGARPNECCESYALPCCTCVVGNHDHAAVHPGRTAGSTSRHVSTCSGLVQSLNENRSFLAELPHQTTVNGLQMCHRSRADPDQCNGADGGTCSFDLMEKSIVMFGHTHFSGGSNNTCRGICPSTGRCPAADFLRVQNGWRYMVNPGAVGQRDGNSRPGSNFRHLNGRGYAQTCRLRHRADPARDHRGGSARVDGQAPLARGLIVQHVEGQQVVDWGQTGKTVC